MVLLDLLHVQRAGFFKLLKLGINKELAHLNITFENTTLQILPFFDLNTPLASSKVASKLSGARSTIAQGAPLRGGTNLSMVKGDSATLAHPSRFLLNNLTEFDSGDVHCFRLIAPKYTPREAILYQKSWSCKIVVKVLLTINEKNSKNNLQAEFSYSSRRALGSKIKDQRRDYELLLVLGELPLMTKQGNFIINGSPRVVLSQLVRTPGIYFTEKNNELQADCIPEEGPWLCIYKKLKIKKIKKKEKIIISYFCYTKQFSSMPFSFVFSTFRLFELYSQFTDRPLLLIKLKALEKIEKFEKGIAALLKITCEIRKKRRLRKSREKFRSLLTDQCYKAAMLFRLQKKFVLDENSRANFREKLGIANVRTLATGRTGDVQPLNSKPPGEAFDSSAWVCRRPIAAKAALAAKAAKAALGSAQLDLVLERPVVSSSELNQRNEKPPLQLKFTPGLHPTKLLSQDLALIVRILTSHKIKNRDDIDDLKNQRVRTPSDQIQQQIQVGILRFQRRLKQVILLRGGKRSITDFLNGALREFFGSNPLSQFLDQTNPLAEITHKRRISKLGFGGIQRESATLKVRTIHATYFGRICPIETPEGLNAGLVNSLTCLSRVNQKGQLVTPLSLLVEGQKQDHFFYYSNKEDHALATTDTTLLKFQRLPKQFISTKNKSQFEPLEPKQVKLRVVSDLQTISLATALIPFLAYDDANRALMGSNMQRQAVPLILPERPIIRTGMESLVVNESGHSFQSFSGGFISYISAQYVLLFCDPLNKRSFVK